MKQRFKLGAICLMTCFSVNQVWAKALVNEDLSAAAAGSANAVVAGADDLSAALYNPAGLAWQQGVQAMVGSQSRYRTLSADTGIEARAGDRNLRDLSMFAISWLPEGSNWGVAGSIVTPYAAGTRWPAGFLGQLGETTADFQRYSADAFWRVNNTFAASLGFDTYDSSIKMNSSAAFFSGSGWSKPGLHAGMRWEIVPFWVLGMNLRQGTDVSISDQLGSVMDVTLPSEVTLALAHDFMDDEVRIELDIKRSNWSSFKDLTVSNNGVISQTEAVSFRDTTDIAIGTTWFWRDRTQLRFGYAYEQGSNQLSAYQPALADLTGHRISAGFGGIMSGMHLDVAWTGLYYPRAEATGVYAAKYKDARYSLMFSLTKNF